MKESWATELANISRHTKLSSWREWILSLLTKGEIRHVQSCCFALSSYCLFDFLVAARISSPVQTDATLLANNSQHMLHPFAHPVSCCWMLLRVVAQSLRPVKLVSQQLPTFFFLFRDRRSLLQQCWTRLRSSSNIVGATHAHYAWITKTYGLYSSHDALQVPNLLGVVASVCTPLPTRTQQLPTLLAQQCRELLRPFARSLKLPIIYVTLWSVKNRIFSGKIKLVLLIASQTFFRLRGSSFVSG